MGENVLIMPGGSNTQAVAVAAPPAPPSRELIKLVMLL